MTTWAMPFSIENSDVKRHRRILARPFQTEKMTAKPQRQAISAIFYR